MGDQQVLGTSTRLSCTLTGRDSQPHTPESVVKNHAGVNDEVSKEVGTKTSKRHRWIKRSKYKKLAHKL